MKAAAYMRCSTKDQDLGSQRMVIEDYCLKNKIEIYKVYSDYGISGTKDSRPELDNMLRDMRQGSFEQVIVFKLDRLARSLKNLINLISEFKNKGIRLISIGDNLDTSNDSPMNKAFIGLLGIFGELEAAVTRERILAGLARSKILGIKGGRRPGCRDKQKRSTSGYYLRYVGKTKEQRRLGPRNIV